MDLRRITTSEIVAAVGGFLLAIGVFLPWYSPNQDNRNANVGGVRDAVSAFDAHTIPALAAAARLRSRRSSCCGSSSATTSCRGRAAR